MNHRNLWNDIRLIRVCLTLNVAKSGLGHFKMESFFFFFFTVKMMIDHRSFSYQQDQGWAINNFNENLMDLAFVLYVDS